MGMVEMVDTKSNDCWNAASRTTETIVYLDISALCKNVSCTDNTETCGIVWELGTMLNTVTFIDPVGLKVILIVHH